MKTIDSERFYEELRKNDLSFMQQGDVMACIKDVLSRQPVVDLMNDAKRRYFVVTFSGVEEWLLAKVEGSHYWKFVNITRGTVMEPGFETPNEAEYYLDSLTRTDDRDLHVLQFTRVQ